MPKYDLVISPPLMNAAGSLGFFPQPSERVDFSHLGAFITNPISLRARTPARTRTCLLFAGGFLLHSGYPNPGLGVSIRRYATRWARSSIPIIVHLLAESADTVKQMVPRVEGLEGVMGIELGLPPGIDLRSAEEMILAALGELPLIVRLAVDDADQYTHSLADLPITAISLGPPRGVLWDAEGKLVRGRLYGPAIFPTMLANLQEAIGSGVPVIAAGGVYQSSHIEALLEAGALGVQLDAVLWSVGWRENVD
jgi:dihydroorotate dehydrogenase